MGKKKQMFDLCRCFDTWVERYRNINIILTIPFKVNILNPKSFGLVRCVCFSIAFLRFHVSDKEVLYNISIVEIVYIP